MEWFFGPKGLKFSEIGCRPPGVGAWDLYSAGNEIDVYREWAKAIVHGETGSAPSRRYASGMVALRPEQDGRITGYSGAEEMNQQYGEWVIDAHLPSAGTATQPVEAGYMANAYVRMRHPDYDALRGMLDAVGQHTARLRLVRVTLLGPQRRPTLDTVAASLRLEGPIATITAGWQERETDDGALGSSSAPAMSTSRCTGAGWR